MSGAYLGVAGLIMTIVGENRRVSSQRTFTSPSVWHICLYRSPCEIASIFLASFSFDCKLPLQSI
jgi:hypothetical protein